MNKAIFVLLAFVALRASAQSCANPLLQRTEVMARFGGAANILSSPRTAGDIPICKNLNSKQVCVNDEGFRSLNDWFTNLKQEFVRNGEARNMARFMNVSVNAKMLDDTDCINKIIGYSLVSNQALSNVYRNVPKPWNWTDIQTQYQQMKDTAAAGKLTGDTQTLINRQRDSKNNMGSYAKQMVQAKAKCSQYVFKFIAQVSCLAASNTYSDYVSGSSSSPRLKVTYKTCTTLKSTCLDYFTYFKKLEQAFSWVKTCTDPIVDKIMKGLAIVNATARDTAINLAVDELNKTNIDRTRNQALRDWSGLTCDNEFNSAFDCGYMCEKIINSTGAKLEVFHGLDVADYYMRRRLLQDNYIDQNNFGVDVDSEDTGASTTIATENPPALGFGSTLFASVLALAASVLFALTC